MNREISKMNKIYKEVVDRFHFLKNEQLILREKAKSYPNCDDVPKQLRLEILEHRLLLNHYQKWIKSINKRLRELEHWQSAESLKKERHGNITV